MCIRDRPLSLKKRNRSFWILPLKRTVRTPPNFTPALQPYWGTYINAHIDSDWEPILSTPPFPEYTFGHSVQSGALAEIMTDLFGDSYAFKDSTHENRTDMDGTPRSFKNFYELAEEAAISRMYGGIHFKEAIELGLQQGYQIGKNVNALNLDK